MEGRTYKQCGERYMNYLKDGLKCGPWTPEENCILMEMHGKMGNKWAEIARILKGMYALVLIARGLIGASTEIVSYSLW